jgi:hypothetical protein
VGIKGRGTMKLKQLKDTLSLYPDNWEVFFSSDEEFSVVRNKGEVAELKGRNVLLIYGSWDSEIKL